VDARGATVFSASPNMSNIPIAGLFLARARIPHKSDDPFLFNFAQTSRGQREQAWMQDGAGGHGELPMNDAQRYRMNAAECLSAAERCGPAYRDLTLAIAASCLSLPVTRRPWTSFSQFGAKHSPRRQSGCLSSFPATLLAIGLLSAGSNFHLKRRGDTHERHRDCIRRSGLGTVRCHLVVRRLRLGWAGSMERTRCRGPRQAGQRGR
jgi:hypothetical protein